MVDPKQFCKTESNIWQTQQYVMNLWDGCTIILSALLVQSMNKLIQVQVVTFDEIHNTNYYIPGI